MSPRVWFTGYERLVGIALSAVAVYILLLVVVRMSGKRSTSKMNNFDWIVTVAAGGLTASGILLESVTVADAAVGLVSLMTLQWLTTWLVVRSSTFSQVVKPAPTLLVHRGAFLEDNLRKARVGPAEVEAAVRGAGLGHLEDAQWVILETDATLSVLAKSDRISGAKVPLLEGVAGLPDA